MPDKTAGNHGFGAADNAARPIGRAAPTRLAGPVSRGSRSRRPIMVGAAIVAALLAGASVSLAATASAPPAAAHSVSSHPGP
jgi:hypothetical protein